MERWIQKNENEYIKISINHFKEKELLDIRIFYFDKSDEVYKPTKKGISIPIENTEKIIEELNNVLFYRTSNEKES